MTDTSAYTGTHKERFDEEGKGKGLEGRDYTPKGPGAVPSLVSGQEGYVLGYQNEGTYNKGIKRPEKVLIFNVNFEFIVKNRLQKY